MNQLSEVNLGPPRSACRAEGGSGRMFTADTATERRGYSGTAAEPSGIGWKPMPH
jgi:hypothetical protein